MGKIFILLLCCFLVTGCGKQSLVQQTCDTYGNYEAVKSTKVDSSDYEGWYCCLKDADRDINNCIYFGE